MSRHWGAGGPHLQPVTVESSTQAGPAGDILPTFFLPPAVHTLWHIILTALMQQPRPPCAALGNDSRMSVPSSGGFLSGHENETVRLKTATAKPQTRAKALTKPLRPTNGGVFGRSGSGRIHLLCHWRSQTHFPGGSGNFGPKITSLEVTWTPPQPPPDSP